MYISLIKKYSSLQYNTKPKLYTTNSYNNKPINPKNNNNLIIMFILGCYFIYQKNR